MNVIHKVENAEDDLVQEEWAIEDVVDHKQNANISFDHFLESKYQKV